MAKTALKSEQIFTEQFLTKVAISRYFNVCSVRPPRYFTFKRKYQQYGPCFQTIFPFLMTMFWCSIILFLLTWNTFLGNINTVLSTPDYFLSNVKHFVSTKKHFLCNTKFLFWTSFRMLCHGDIFLLSHSNKNIITCQKINQISFLCDTKN